MNKNLLLSIPLFFIGFIVFGQSPSSTFEKDSAVLKQIYNKALTEAKAYDWLDHLANKIGGRLSGSRNAEKAVKYTKSELEKLGFNVWLQPVMVPKWVRGNPEYAYVEAKPAGTKQVNICALGGSVPTPGGGLEAQVVEVKNFEELKQLGKEKIEGKIVFYNRPMDPTYISTFKAYSEAADQRYRGAAEAAKYGAAGVLVRSLTLHTDEYPHAGSMSYLNTPEAKKIPAAAISTRDADYLSGIISLQPDATFYFKMNCRNMGEVQSHNVIAELKGSEHPEEIIVVGGHLDSWDLGQGAQDDGAGVTQAMEVLHLFQELKIKPKRTIRVVLFMNEENGARGAQKYAQVAKAKKEHHIFALESDAGGFTPRGFSFDTDKARLKKINAWKPLFEPYLIHEFQSGGSGTDVDPLKTSHTVLAGLQPDSQRYFDYHHAATDVFEVVNKRELELGAATMTALIYLIDQYGI